MKIQFKRLFNSKDYPIQYQLLWLNSIDHSIQNNSMWINSVDDSIPKKGNFYMRYEILANFRVIFVDIEAKSQLFDKIPLKMYPYVLFSTNLNSNNSQF